MSGIARAPSRRSRTTRAPTRWRGTRSRPRTTCGVRSSTSSSRSSPYLSPGGARARLGSFGSTFATRVAELEGYARPLWGIVPLVAGGGTFAHWDRWVAGLAHGTDPDHEEYWGPCGAEIDQRMVEMAAIGFALGVHARAPVGSAHRAPARPRDRVVARHRARRAGAEQLAVLPPPRADGVRARRRRRSTATRRRGRSRCSTPSRSSDGWYTDGAGGNVDYYVPFAFHTYGLVLAASGLGDRDAAARYVERAATFAPEFRHWFAPDGARGSRSAAASRTAWRRAASGVRSRWPTSTRSTGRRARPRAAPPPVVERTTDQRPRRRAVGRLRLRQPPDERVVQLGRLAVLVHEGVHDARGARRPSVLDGRGSRARPARRRSRCRHAGMVVGRDEGQVVALMAPAAGAGRSSSRATPSTRSSRTRAASASAATSRSTASARHRLHARGHRSRHRHPRRARPRLLSEVGDGVALVAVVAAARACASTPRSCGGAPWHVRVHRDRRPTATRAVGDRLRAPVGTRRVRTHRPDDADAGSVRARRRLGVGRRSSTVDWADGAHAPATLRALSPNANMMHPHTPRSRARRHRAAGDARLACAVGASHDARGGRAGARARRCPPDLLERLDAFAARPRTRP